jgi:hypothetical protein
MIHVDLKPRVCLSGPYMALMQLHKIESVHFKLAGHASLRKRSKWAEDA